MKKPLLVIIFVSIAQFCFAQPYFQQFFDGDDTAASNSIFIQMDTPTTNVWQIGKPHKIDSTLISKAIAQFERTLISYRSKYDRVLTGKAEFTKEEIDGLVLLNDMTGGDCLHCHTTDANSLGTTLDFKNNGLDTVMFAANYKDKGRGKITGSIRDYGKFKVPSLRNVALTVPYMHDGRFKTLEEVIDFYSDGVNACVNIDARMGSAKNKGVHLTAEEKQKIIVFLKTLSDSAFISDPAFSNPFVKK